jgi:curved DNA-binding protein
MSDYYNTLGVSRGSSDEEIKKAYKKLAMKHHPDRGGDTAKFQSIQEAYATLSDPEKRSQYDNPQPQMGGFHFNGGFPPGFESFFANFNGFSNQPQYAHQQNKSLNVQTTITLEEAFSGKELVANLKLPSGRTQTIQVNIPAGIDNGSTMRLHGLGDDVIPNVPRGDVNLTIQVLPNDRFQRQGDDLMSNIEISCIEAMLGSSVEIESIDGKRLDVKINAGIQPGQIMSIPGYGMPKVNDNRFKGRLLLNINITIPTLLTDEQKDLLNKFNSL